jgi:O-antigen ligase
MATADSFARESWRGWIVAGALGACAAAIALAPSIEISLGLALAIASAPAAWWVLSSPVRWIYLFLFSALLLPPLPIALGDSGPHVALAFAALGVVSGLVRLRQWRVRPGGLTVSLALFFWIVLSSGALAVFYSGGLIAAGSLARGLLFGVSVYLFFYVAHGPGRHAIARTFAPARFLFWTALCSALFACVDFYFQFPAPAGYGPQFIWLDSGVYRRAQGFFYEASTLGNLCAFFLVMAAVALLRPPREAPLPRMVLLAGSSVFSAALLLSYSRSSLLNLVVALAALFVLERKRLALRRWAAILVVCFGAGGALAWRFLPSITEAYRQRILGSGEFFFTQTGKVLSGRLESWGAIASFLADHPWHALFGIGYKTLPYSDFIGQPTIADNMYLSLLAETGVVGLLVFFGLNIAILRVAWRAARNADPHTRFHGTWIFCFWTGELAQMLSGDLLTYWRVLPVYFFILALTYRDA